MTPERIANIPAELRERKQWVVWALVERNGKITKPPLHPVSGRPFNATDPVLWMYFEEALEALRRGWVDDQGDRQTFGGIGFAVSRQDPYVGFDIDHCIDPETGEVDPWALEKVAALNSYTERTPSGTGLRTWVKGTLPKSGAGRSRNKRTGLGTKGQIASELYGELRYFTVTGQHLEGTPRAIEERQDELTALHHELFPPEEEQPTPAAQAPVTQVDTPRAPAPLPATETDAELLAKMFASKHGPEILSLWNGHTGAYNGDDSAADLALCNHLAWWCRLDPVRIDQLFRQSRLYRAKWDEERPGPEGTYGRMTIGVALAGRTPSDCYSPSRVWSIGPELERKLPPTPSASREELLVAAAAEDGERRAELLRELAATVLDDALAAELWAGRVADAKLGFTRSAFRKCVEEFQKARREAAQAQRHQAPATTEDEPSPYQVVNGRICLRKEVQAGDDWKTIFTPLCNFDARITAEEIRDDGAERKTVFTLAGSDATGAELAAVQVPAERFPSMGWVAAAWGNRAVVLAGRSTQDHLRTAIQLLSSDVARRIVYGHMGWRLLDGEWFYLHRGGAIGPDGSVPGIEVLLEGPLRHYALPDPPTGEGLPAAVRRSLALLTVAPLPITYPLLAATYRAPLCELVPANFSLFLAGQSGSQKSALSALAQAHFGAGFRGDVFPENWSTSENTLEQAAFLAKDALFFVDDYVPRGTALDVQQLNRKADRLFRGQANQAGRGRMRADGSRRPTYYPRGLVAGSGEEEPAGVSVKAQLVLLELARGDVDLSRLTEAQKDSAAGVFTEAMAGYVRWLAPQMEALRGQLGERQQALRTAARSVPTQHDRTPDNAAGLALGLETFLRFAVDVKAITSDELQTHWRGGWNALMGSASSQAAYQESDDPASRFVALLSSALISGAAHLASAENGKEPAQAARWGWRFREGGWGDFYRQLWQPLGPLVGWLDGEDLYLDPEAVFKFVQEFSRGQGTPLAISQTVLWKRLWERGLLASRDEKRETLKVRRIILGGRVSVLHLRVGSLTGSTADLSDLVPWEGQEIEGAAA